MTPPVLAKDECTSEINLWIVIQSVLDFLAEVQDRLEFLINFLKNIVGSVPFHLADDIKIPEEKANVPKISSW